MKKLSFFLIALLMSLGLVSISHALIWNGGFETGNFTGWQTTGDASIQTSTLGSGPTEGQYQAVLTNDLLAGSGNAPPNYFNFSGSRAVPQSVLEPFLGLPTRALNAITLPSGSDPTAPAFVHPGSGMKQSFYGTAGSLISFNWDYLTSDGLNYDYAFVTLTSSSTLFLSKLAGNYFLPTPLKPSTTGFVNETGFQTFSFQLPETGTYTLGLGVVQVDDDIIDSALIVDSVTVPEPSTLLLLGSGLVGLGVIAWGRSRRS